MSERNLLKTGVDPTFAVWNIRVGLLHLGYPAQAFSDGSALRTRIMPPSRLH
jgi:hypothetical protein